MRGPQVNQDTNAKLRQLPQVDAVLHQPALEDLAQALPHQLLADAIRSEIQRTRDELLTNECPDIGVEAIAKRVAARMETFETPTLRRVINATGVIIHTNLGRSVLPEEALIEMSEVASGYSTLEYDLEGMKRGSRNSHCESLICALTGAEAALAVNNNAAAVLLVLTEFASGHEAVISRGELVEIGGSFRIPDIMGLSHASMVEVGTTNKTHLDDYRRAITDDTTLLLKVHPSNYRMIGFTENVPVETLRGLVDDTGRGRGSADDSRILIFEDLGSGALIDLTGTGDITEPTVADALSAGADLVSFSGDKLLGGPQAGIIVGSREFIGRLKSNPLSRALRLDKMTIAALEATLRLYLNPEVAVSRIPTLRMLQESADHVRTRAEELRRQLETRLPQGCARLDVIEGTSRAGGGALPMCEIPTALLRVSLEAGDAQGCEEFLEHDCDIPIIARISQDAVLFDLRTVSGDDECGLIAAELIAYFESL